MLAGNQPREIAAFLFGAAMHADLIDAEIGMRAIRQPDGAGRARYLFHSNAVLEITEAGAAPLLLDRDAMNTQRAERRPQIARKAVAAVDLVGAGMNFFGWERADALAQHVRGLAQAEIETANTAWRHLRSPSQAQLMPRRRGWSFSHRTLTKLGFAFCDFAHHLFDQALA